MKHWLLLLLAILTWIPNTDARPRRGIIMVRFRTAEQVNRICRTFPDMEPKLVMSNIPTDILGKARQRATTEGIRLNDPNLLYMFQMKDSERAQALLNLLQREPSVLWAMPVPKAYPAGISVPNIKPGQNYLLNQPGSLNITSAWDLGLSGKNQTVIDLEFNWNYAHEDLGLEATQTPIEMPFTPGYADNQYLQHGTAVLGLVGAKGNGKGVTGIAPNATLRTAALDEFGTAGIYSILTQQLTNYALGKTIGGQIVLVEYQLPGPGTFGACVLGNGCLPAEAYPLYFEAIQDLVNLGLVVVEAAGNGGLNLDLPENQLQTCGAGKCPNLAKESTGAILVGASTGAGMKKASFSNCGKRVDTFAWGQGVVTTGYGDHPISVPLDPNKAYTMGFSGTSAATAMIGGIAALAEEEAQALHPDDQAYLNSGQMRQLLQLSGVKQTDAGCAIGSQPDMGKTVDLLTKGTVKPTIIWKDSDGDSVPDITDNCPFLPNFSQKNLDGDGSGDLCDSDIDGDGTVNEQDAFPANPLEQKDSDGDGIGDNQDPDMDGDGVLNVNDKFPLDPKEEQDTDGDGLGDNQDPDADGDGISNEKEIALGLNPKSSNTDGDLWDDGTEVGPDLNTPLDTDNDGIIDALEWGYELGTTFGQLEDPSEMALYNQDGKKYLFVLDQFQNAIHVFEQFGDKLEFRTFWNLGGSQQGAQFPQQRDMAVSKSGYVFIADSKEWKVDVLQFKDQHLTYVTTFWDDEAGDKSPYYRKKRIAVSDQDQVFILNGITFSSLRMFQFKDQKFNLIKKILFPEDTYFASMAANKDQLFVISGNFKISQYAFDDSNLYLQETDSSLSQISPFPFGDSSITLTEGNNLYVSLTQSLTGLPKEASLFHLKWNNNALDLVDEIPVPSDEGWSGSLDIIDIVADEDSLYLNGKWVNTTTVGFVGPRQHKIQRWNIEKSTQDPSYGVIASYDVKNFLDSEMLHALDLTVDKSGYIFVSKGKENKISVYKQYEGTISKITDYPCWEKDKTELWEPGAIATDHQGHLFVRNGTDRIIILKFLDNEVSYLNDYIFDYNPNYYLHDFQLDRLDLSYDETNHYLYAVHQSYKNGPSVERLIFSNNSLSYDTEFWSGSYSDRMSSIQHVPGLGVLLALFDSSVYFEKIGKKVASSKPTKIEFLNIGSYTGIKSIGYCNKHIYLAGYDNKIKVYNWPEEGETTVSTREFGGYGFSFGKFSKTYGVDGEVIAKSAPQSFEIVNNKMYILDAFRLQIFPLPPDEQLNP